MCVLLTVSTGCFCTSTAQGHLVLYYFMTNIYYLSQSNRSDELSGLSRKKLCLGRIFVWVTMTGCGRPCFLTLLRCDASSSPVFLAVAGTVGLVVAMALPRHPDTNKQSPVTCRQGQGGNTTFNAEQNSEEQNKWWFTVYWYLSENLWVSLLPLDVFHSLKVEDQSVPLIIF